MFKNRILLFHFITALVVIIWGTTFVSTKVLLQHGLGPMDIMFFRRGSLKTQLANRAVKMGVVHTNKATFDA